MRKLLAAATIAVCATIGVSVGSVASAAPSDSACHGQLTAVFAQDGISAQDVADFVEANLPGLAAVIDSQFGNDNGDLSAGEVHKAAKATFC